MTLLPLLEKSGLIVTLGPGGVGKTTTAAALGLRAASAGRDTLVCTIDPARRLASSLGVTLDDTPAALPSASLAAVGCPPGARMSAMMLDAESALDRMLLSSATDPESAARLQAHPFYRTMVRDLPGMHEYAAIARLYELREQGRWDLVVLDTPPTAHALDFLDAPRRLVRALESPAVQWIVRPYLKAGHFSVSRLGGARAYVLRRLAQIVGTGMLERIAEFLVLFGQLVDGVRQRTEAVSRLLGSGEVAYVIVSSPTPSTVGEAAALAGQLGRRRLSVDGLVFNRMHRLAAARPAPADAIAERLAAEPAIQALSAEDQLRLLPELALTHQRFARLAQSDEAQLERLVASLPGDPARALVPLLAQDVHDLPGLARIASYL